MNLLASAAHHLRDEYVCSKCFSDEGLQNFVAYHAESEECDFCGAISNEPIAAPLDEVIRHIAQCISAFYDDPANTLPYESAEDGYQGATYSTDEVFQALELDFPNDKDDRLRDAISQGMPNDLWSDADPFALSRFEQLSFSWDEFCRVIKHQRRYFFTQRRKREDSELYSPGEILKFIFSFAEEAGAFVKLPQGTHLFRARYQPSGEAYETAGTLGPPPLEHAIQTNRMSPPGIVMTYVSDDPGTALAETAVKLGSFAIGEFVTERDALILDLTQLPPVPSAFEELSDTLEYDPRPRLSFLHSISREISRPIARDDRVHIEYVPTQVVTEYVRTAVIIDGRPVDGIRYRSSRRKGQTSLVLFADQDNVILDPEERREFYHFAKDRWLRLLKAIAKTVSRKDIAGWAKTAGGLF
jgi:hypothetical protein